MVLWKVQQNRKILLHAAFRMRKVTQPRPYWLPPVACAKGPFATEKFDPDLARLRLKVRHVIPVLHFGGVVLFQYYFLAFAE